ncbi:glycoside hydrolase family 78 protein [Sphingobacterium bambusae]|uniref:alpha-L-rhamnosidase n=1 Tax=Sphingobacterium bambusae TaxID=662858 RepID=A0ABW6BNJ3_9SPHI|nr:glycoside hydrolase family 78 protein [Sphingobacterium bambusae]WPL48224.1 glycoside hydrolase family 78 protein [Sphingobacterium bambusae]
MRLLPLLSVAFCLLVNGTYFAMAQGLSVSDLRIDHQHTPLTVTSDHPLMSWKILSTTPETVQQSYEVRVAKAEQDLVRGKNLHWITKGQTEQSIALPYAGPVLESGKPYYWQVRVQDNHGNRSAWSKVQHWRMALGVSSWKAQWIGVPGKDTSMASPLFRKSYTIKKKIKSATAHVSARGLYEAYINGQKIGDAYLTPGWTSYKKQIQYQAFDVTALLNVGKNTVSAVLGDGWYRGRIGFNNQRAFYGDTRALLLQVEITYTDGSQETWKTDDSWKTSFGAIISSDIYDGETYDARLAKKGWKLAEYTESPAWLPVQTLPYPYDNLVGNQSPLVRKRERLKPQKISRTATGDIIVDFGQNMVGWVEINAQGEAGTTIIVEHAEVLDRNGNFYTTNLRSAKQQNRYVLGSDQEQSFSPHFSFQGFRYVKISGYPGELSESAIAAVALYSDMEETGTFETSNPLINQLQKNIVWGQKGNFVDVPTDCPQRDERLGWTGDAQAFFNTAAYNMDVQAFFSKWLKDLEADQHQNGSVPFVIPDILTGNDAGAAGWGDVATIVPWGMYQAYGDVGILERQYNSMKAWVDFMHSKSKNDLWNTGFHFGDWLFYRPDDDNDGRAAVTDKYLIAQCFYAHSTEILANSAKILGKTSDEQTYRDLLTAIRSAFQQEYLTPSGRLVSSTQTAYVLALQFDMLPVDLRQQAAERLVENVRSYGNHLTTGFLGTPYLCHVLSRFGHQQVAYDLLMQETYPSWLYPVKMGATTIWERWDGIKPDGTFQTASMNSFNHYAYGAIGDWMYKNIAGIHAETAGYKDIRIAPILGGGIKEARASLETPYGKVSVSWEIKNDLFSLKVSIPPNTRANIVLPQQDEDQKSLRVGSGTYTYTTKMK